ncbi:MAG: hypothetical protein JWN41_1096 [Thermoleophilia bacterium]|nr:hypothetical protein [Thermoleophilia bacterium]
MYEQSSYADGGAYPGAAASSYGAHGATLTLPPPKPARLHWSTIVMLVGLAACGLATVAAIAGIPAHLGYDVDGAAHRNDPTHTSALGLTASLDGNMKWIDAASADTPSTYVGYIRSINRSEGSIAGMTTALAGMAASVDAIDAGLTSLSATTAQMNRDMASMSADTTAAASSMNTLAGGVGNLSASMVELSAAAVSLTQHMAAVQHDAHDIATNGIRQAKSATAELNAVLPNGIPRATEEGGQPTKLGAFDTDGWK